MLKLLVLCLYDITDLKFTDLDLASSHEFAFVKCDHDWKYSNKVAEVNQLNNLAKMVAGIVQDQKSYDRSDCPDAAAPGQEELQGYQNLFDSIIDEMPCKLNCRVSVNGWTETADGAESKSQSDPP